MSAAPQRAALRFDALTLMPQMFAPFTELGVARRAYDSRQMELQLWNPRDFAEGNYRRVDERPFGGGPGMVMLAEPLARCVEAAQAARAAAGFSAAAPVVLFAPAGEPLNHAAVQQWAGGEGALLVCGRYEGIDQRFIDSYVTHCISLGDFVLSGGEIAALALLDAVARLLPGVLHTTESHETDSFNPALDGLLDCPHYTRPEVWREQRAPAVLLGGDHARIERWRRDERLRLTARVRPDLIAAARTAQLLSPRDEQALAQLLDSTV